MKTKLSKMGHIYLLKIYVVLTAASIIKALFEPIPVGVHLSTSLVEERVITQEVDAITPDMTRREMNNCKDWWLKHFLNCSVWA